MAGELWLADSNILLRWVQPTDGSFETVRSAMGRIEDSGGIPCYTSQNLGEFWNVLTRPVARNGYGLSPSDANSHAISVEGRMWLLSDTPEVHETWRKLLVDHRVSGIQVHDARIAASMLVHGVERILTFNTRDFTRFPGIKAIHPAELSKL